DGRLSAAHRRVRGAGLRVLQPGRGAPGVLGALALLLGLFGTAQLPVNAAGVVLFLTAIVLFILELKVGGHAIFGVGGVIALIASGLLLFNTGGAFSIDVPIVIAAAAIIGSLLLWGASKAAAARHRPVVTGWEE